MSQKLEESARAISSALAITESTNLAALRECARATAQVLDGFIENKVTDQTIVEELVRAFAHVADGQRTVIQAHYRLHALGRKLGLDPKAWGDSVPYPSFVPVSGRLRSVEAA